MKKTGLCLLLLFFAVIVSSAYAMKDPAAVYCSTLGYQYEIKQNENGNEAGICVFPENEGKDNCSSWEFMSGKCGMEYSYCAKEGYLQKTGTGTECASEDLLAECLLCVLPDGKTAEVTSLMDLDLGEGICGDGACVIGETHESCPQDCPVTTTLEEITTIPVEETTTWIPVTTRPPEATTTTILESLCGNSVCDPVENFDSCPGDCSKPTGPSDYLLYVVIIVVLLVILFVVKKKLFDKKIQ
jgi:putative hemolysin